MRCFEEALEYAKGQPLSTSTTRAISSPRLSNRKRRECSKRFGKASSRSIVCDICNLLILCMQVRLNRILVSLKAVGHTVNEVVMHYRMQGLRPVSVNTIILAASSLMASPKDQVVSSGSHPAPVAPVSDPVWVCCVRAKPFPRRLNDQGLPDSYGVYRSPWISCSFARHLVIERYPRTGGSEETKRQSAASIPSVQGLLHWRRYIQASIPVSIQMVVDIVVRKRERRMGFDAERFWIQFASNALRMFSGSPAQKAVHVIAAFQLPGLNREKKPCHGDGELCDSSSRRNREKK